MKGKAESGGEDRKQDQKPVVEVQRVDSFISLTFLDQSLSVNNCTKEEMKTSSRRIIGASPTPLWHTQDTVGVGDGSSVANLSRMWTPTDT